MCLHTRIHLVYPSDTPRSCIVTVRLSTVCIDNAVEGMRQCLWLMMSLSCAPVIGTSCKPKSCADVKCYDSSNDETSAIVYNRNTRYMAHCDMEADQGGWTSLLRRGIKGKVGFHNRKWVSYINGFGEAKTQYWVGLQHLHEVIGDTPVLLRFDLEKTDRSKAVAIYSDVTIGSEDDRFRLRYGKFLEHVSNAGNALCTDCQFHTPDNDTTYTKCASTNKYRGWFNDDCVNPQAFLFGPMESPPQAGWLTYSHDLRTIEMKYRPEGYNTNATCKNPCRNKGACVYSSETPHKCHCRKGFSGEFCEKVIIGDMTDDNESNEFTSEMQLVVVATLSTGLFVSIGVSCYFRSLADGRRDEMLQPLRKARTREREQEKEKAKKFKTERRRSSVSGMTVKSSPRATRKGKHRK